MSDESRRLERVISGTALAVLVAGCLLVLWPFLSSLLWAVVLSFTTWPLYQRVLGLIGGRRTLAALIMMLATTLILLVPFMIVGFTLADNVKDLSTASKQWLEAGPPDAPGWLVNLPLVGERLADSWRTIAGDSETLMKSLSRLIEPASALVLSGGLLLGRGLVELAISILIAFFMYRDGLGLATRARSAMQRIAGPSGDRLLTLAGATVRSVVYGIIGTALVQGVIAGIGFIIAGVPGAVVLATLTFFLSVLPVGPPLVWVPAAIWLYHTRGAGWATFMVIWGVVVSSVDNVVKPWLISQGSDMPFILIFFGVIGGALGFGFIGVFLGPTLLAVGFRLFQEWTAVIAPPGGSKDAPTASEG